MQQLSMWPVPPKPPKPAKPKKRKQPTPDQIFASFLTEHGDICRRALVLAKSKVRAGAKRITVAALWEELRGKVGPSLNNSARAPLARWLVAQDGSLGAVIEMRVRKSERRARARAQQKAAA